MKGAIVVVAALAIVLGTSTASDVQVLTGDNFDASIESGTWFIKFYAPWCGHCKSLAPTWDGLATTLKGDVNVAKVDATVDGPLATRFGVRGYPTLKLVSNGKVYDYQGGRDADSLEKFAVGGYSSAKSSDVPAAPKAPSPGQATVKVLTGSSFDHSISKGKWFVKFYAPWCGHCKNLAPTWDQLAGSLDGEVNVAKIDMTAGAARPLSERFGIKGYPTLKLFADGKMYDYQGGRDVSSLEAFAKTGYSSKGGKPIPEGGAKVEEDAPEAAGNAEDVTVLDDSNFDSKTSSGVWFIKFYAPWCGHCKKLVPTWEQIGTSLKGEVNVAKVDATAAQSLAMRFGVKGYPTLKLIANNQLYSYQGGRDASSLERYAKGGYLDTQGEAVPSVPTKKARVGPSDVVTLTEGNFEDVTQASSGSTTGDWFIKFYAPWCGHCKSMADSWEEAATELKGRVNVAEVDGTQHKNLMRRFGVRGFPTLLFISKGKVYKHTGHRDVDNLVAFATGGYELASASDVPGPSGLVAAVIETLENSVNALYREISKLGRTHLTILAATFLIGILCGVCLMAFVWWITGKLSPEYEEMPMEVPAASGGGGSKSDEDEDEDEEDEDAAKESKKDK